ncbi:hypothetical protein GEOBRER4_n3742 [Citrifermentans bremense]|uniref:Uncharacterized protein n=1 Tax=Citrifermentans bremense TaxID=60035 RepID=A0A6S6M371_9BACT|nr:site-specific integrase [Citrifermentans bremense]BCG48847.1 hypothetical protein GEOBRER4_n3742 [Citrifermentans bremense]
MCESEANDAAIPSSPLARPDVCVSRPWLDELDTPLWLNDRAALYANEWKISDEGFGGTKRLNWEYPLYDPATMKVSLLTDPDNEALLEVAQRFCIALREGHIRSITSAENQVAMTRRLLSIFAWMRLNFIYSVDYITTLDFRLFMQAAPWGLVRLLDAESRFDNYLESLQRSGRKIPVRFIRTSFDSKKMYERIDASEVHRQIGVDPELATKFGKNFTFKFWTAVAALNGSELVRNNQKHLLELVVEPEREPMKLNSLQKYVQAWQALHDMGYLLPQRCSVNPASDYVSGENMSSKKVAREALTVADIEDSEGITETMPDLQAFHIVDRACRWVINYSDDLLDLRKLATQRVSNAVCRSQRLKALTDILEAYAPKNFSAEDLGAPWPLIAAGRKNAVEVRGLSINHATSIYLMAASAIVIAAFTARRRGEILTIKGGEQTDNDQVPRALYLDERGEPWMWSYIEKTFQKWDRTPIPPVVVRAIEVLEALTESTRKKSGSRNLFEVEHLRGGSLIRFDIVEAINLFADFVNVPLLEDGSKWIFRPHQFRRFFALLYMYRYNYGEHGKMEALSHQLRHFNMEMTKRYIEEIYESDMLKAHSKNIVVDLMSGVLRGKRKALGPGGEAMKKHLDEMLHEVIKHSEILSGEEPPWVAHKIAERVMMKLNIDMIPFKWGFCYAYKHKQTGEFRGNCVADGVKADQPDVAKATPKRCLGCEHLYVDENFRTLWETGATTYRSRLERGGISDIMRDYAQEYARVYEEGLKAYFEDGSEWGE